MTTSRLVALLAITGLAIGLSACDNPDPLSPSFGVSRTAAPAAPTNLAATAESYHQILLAWQDNATNEKGFEVHRSTTGPNGEFTLFTTYPWPNTTQGGNDGLQPSTEYCYKVRAFTLLGQSGKIRAYSEFSNTACGTTPGLPVPAAPSDVRASPDAWGRIQVIWTDNASNESGFRIERSASSSGPWASVGTVGSNVAVFYDWQAPAPEQQACYRVLAFNSYGDSEASNVPCTARPAAPTGLVATASGSDVDLSWTDNSSVEDGYQVQRWTSGAGPFDVVATLPANATAYHDAGLADDVYWYQVKATKDGGTSGSSNNATATVLTRPPVPPSAVDAIPSSSSVVSITWSNSTTASGFRVERSTDGGGNWVSAGTTGTGETGFSDAGQASEQQVCYRVIATNSFGESSPSNMDCTIPPAGPTNLVAAVDVNGSIVLNWTDNSAFENGYEVWRTFQYCDWDEYGNYYCYDYYDVIATLGAGTTTYQDSYWVTSGENSYIVVAIRDGGHSDWSNAVSVTVP